MNKEIWLKKDEVDALQNKTSCYQHESKLNKANLTKKVDEIKMLKSECQQK